MKRDRDIILAMLTAVIFGAAIGAAIMSLTTRQDIIDAYLQGRADERQEDSR